jgi:hypothetical protein
MTSKNNPLSVSEMSELEMKILEETHWNMLAEFERVTRKFVVLRKEHPELDKSLREVLSEWGKIFVVGSLSFERAKILSDMLHSEDEGICSIQEALNKQPVNALTLATIIRLEREREPGRLEEMVSNALTKYKFETGKKGGDVTNEKNRKLHEAIRTRWATGNFLNREICTDQEWEALGFGSRKAARNALLRSPDPVPWPAKKPPKK